MPKAKLNKIDLKPVAALLLNGETNQSARERKEGCKSKKLSGGATRK